MYLVYKYTSPTNKYYIGQTSYSVEKRRGNNSFYKYADSPAFYQALQKYGVENFKCEILKEGLTKKEADYWERYYIAFFHSFREQGYNLTLGGDGNQKYNHEEIVKDYLSGMTKSEILQKYKCCSETYKRILHSAGIDGQKRINRQAGKYHAKAVLQFSLDNKFIAEYPSLSEAGRATGVVPQNIGMVCRGQRPTAGGFIWKYKEK